MPIAASSQRPSTSHPRHIGRILVDAGLITSRQLEAALTEQKRSGAPLGRILVDCGALMPESLAAALALQPELATLNQAIGAAVGGREPLGELLLQARRISSEQLDWALLEQTRRGVPLGKVCTDQGWLTQQELKALLAFQASQSRNSDSPGPLSLGNLLLSTGSLTPAQLEVAVSKQKVTRTRLGALLVEMGLLRFEQVASAVRLQRQLSGAALAAVLAIAGMTHHGDARAGSGRLQIVVSATVAAVANVQVRSQAAGLTITPEDIRRGYVDAPLASELEIKTNSPEGYALDFHGLTDSFRSIRVTGPKGVTEFSGEGGTLVQRHDGPGMSVVRLGYRFQLGENARPGQYSWPLAVSVRPL